MKWWGYIHRNGTVHIKRYFSPLDITEANESPFVAIVLPPVEAKTKEEAEQYLKQNLKDRLR